MLDSYRGDPDFLSNLTKSLACMVWVRLAVEPIPQESDAPALKILQALCKGTFWAVVGLKSVQIAQGALLLVDKLVPNRAQTLGSRDDITPAINT